MTDVIPGVIKTVSGRYVNVREPDPATIDIHDIACGLSKVCRYTGQVNPFYSVAEHSVRMVPQVPSRFALEALLHDATEAYLGDVPAPVKALIPDYKKIEKRLQKAIYARFGIHREESIEVELVDKYIREREMAVVRVEAGWKGWEPRYGEITFLKIFHALKGDVENGQELARRKTGVG